MAISVLIINKCKKATDMIVSMIPQKNTIIYEASTINELHEILGRVYGFNIIMMDSTININDLNKMIISNRPHKFAYPKIVLTPTHNINDFSFYKPLNCRPLINAIKLAKKIITDDISHTVNI